MQYMLLLYAEERTGLAIPPDLMAKAMQSMGAYQAALEKAGAFVMTTPLARTADARTLRIHGGTMVTRPDDAEKTFVTEGGELRVHDGPYADTREQLGGVYIIESASMDDALAWAAKCPAAQWGPIEVRAMVAGY